MVRGKEIEKHQRKRVEGTSQTGGKRHTMPLSTGENGLFLPAVLGLLCAISVMPLSAVSYSTNRLHKSQVVKMDEAVLTISNELHSDIVVSWLSDHCYECLFQPFGLVSAGSEPGTPSVVDFRVNTQHPITLQLNSTPVNLEQCRLYFHFGEQGKYSLWAKNLSNPAQVNCSLVVETEPINSYLPILFAFLGFTGLALLAAIVNSILRLEAIRSLYLRWGNAMETDRLINSELGPSTRLVESSIEVSVPATAGKRLRSLDTFRGFSLVIMVFVNYGGGRYWFFRHESWNGLTVADLVFPWFVFIMGTSIALSVTGTLRRGSSRTKLLAKVFWRSVQLFIIGLLVINPNYCQGPLSWESIRIPGVLQRLAFSYLCVSSLDIFVARLRLDNLPVGAWWHPLCDFLLYWPAWLCVVLLESLWLCLTFLLEVPGCPIGYLGPGGIGDFGLYPNCTGGAAGFIDRWLLGDSHIYQSPSSRVVYQTTMPYDPEGVLGSINSIIMAFLGLQAGKILLHYSDLHSKIISRFLVWGLILGVLSALLTKCSKDHGFIPINKNLWSLSYVTTLSCFAFILLAMIYYIVDVKRWWSGAPFFYPGMNSILVYVGHEVFEEYFPFRWKMVNSQSHTEHLTQNLVATSIWVIISFILYKKKIFWKI